MNNHIGTFSIRVLRKRFLERRIARFVGSHHGVINKLQVVATAGIVKFRRLFSLHLARAIIVDYLLFKVIGARFLRVNVRIDHHIPVTRLVEIGVRKIKMLFPVRSTAASQRVQLIVAFLCLVGIEQARSRSQTIVRLFLFKLHADGKHLQRICRK